MAQINYIIPPQKYELARNRIGEILIDEFDNQLLLTGNYDLDIKVDVEGQNPYYDKVELPAINVSLLNGGFGNKNQGSVDGNYIYAIDAFTSAKTTNTMKGDKLSTFKLHKLLGIARAILEDPKYKTLGYVPGFVMRTGFTNIDIMEIKKDDALNTIGGRLLFAVSLNEITALGVPRLIDGYETRVKISNTDQGYFYQGENY